MGNLRERSINSAVEEFARQNCSGPSDSHDSSENCLTSSIRSCDVSGDGIIELSAVPSNVRC